MRLPRAYSFSFQIRNCFGNSAFRGPLRLNAMFVGIASQPREPVARMHRTPAPGSESRFPLPNR